MTATPPVGSRVRVTYEGDLKLLGRIHGSLYLRPDAGSDAWPLPPVDHPLTVNVEVLPDTTPWQVGDSLLYDREDGRGGLRVLRDRGGELMWEDRDGRFQGFPDFYDRTDIARRVRAITRGGKPA